VSAPHLRFDAAFAARTPGAPPGLIPYLTAGYPHRDDTAALLLAAERAGAFALELGIPFSDPLADGPTIQRSGWRALQNGMTLSLALEQLADARRAGLTVPVAVMTYLNPVLAMGVERFAAAAFEAGADGVILPDLPAGEAAALHGVLLRAGLAHIPLVAPTSSPERVAAIIASASGFVYCVGVTGVTGARDALAPEALQLLERVRSVTPLPRALGFGISRPEHRAALAGRAEAVVVGSALLAAVGELEDQPERAVSGFVQGMLGAAASR
jgi:tryptophan synthase alpha chain